MIHKKRFILIITTLVVISALLHRGYPVVGLVSTLLLLSTYILCDVRATVAYLFNFKRVNKYKKIKSATSVALLLVLATGIIAGQIPYFFMLVLLAIDYLMYDNQTVK